MKNSHLLFIYLSTIFFYTSCKNSVPEAQNPPGKNKTTTLLPNNYTLRHNDGDVNAFIEIPSGTIEKWELNKLNGKIEQEFINKKARIVNYIGYPGNYGLIPQTLLSKEKGGDGDPLDVLVIGPPEARGSIIKSKIIGVLFLMDQGEQDDKLIAVSEKSQFYHLNDIAELNKNYTGVSDIIKLWFTNYKGPDKIKSTGFGNRQRAEEILTSARQEYKSNNALIKFN